MPLYIEKINGDANRPTDQQGEYRAICLFRKLENRKKAEICNFKDSSVDCVLRGARVFVIYFKFKRNQVLDEVFADLTE